MSVSKEKHILDWYMDNTPSNEKEYEKGCLTAAIIIAVIFFTLLIGLLIVSK